MVEITRRKLIQTGTLITSLAAAPKAFASISVGAENLSEKCLRFSNTHTGETLDCTYYKDGQLQTDALRDINHILRDFRTGDITAMDPKLLDWLFDLQHRLGTDSPFHIISGYRSPKTNNMLRGNSNGVAKKSWHMFGRAIDIRLPGTSTKGIQKTAIDMKRGGVGYYASSDFVHLDTGHPRQW